MKRESNGWKSASRTLSNGGRGERFEVWSQCGRYEQFLDILLTIPWKSETPRDIFSNTSLSPGRDFSIKPIRKYRSTPRTIGCPLRLAFDLGARIEHQAATHTQRIAPRAGVAWTPFAEAR